MSPARPHRERISSPRTSLKCAHRGSEGCPRRGFGGGGARGEGTERQEFGDTGSCHSLGQRANAKAKGRVGELCGNGARWLHTPPPTFPLQVFAPGQAQDPEDRCFFHFLERHVSVEATRVMPLRGAWTWLWPRSKGGGVFQPKLSVASTPYSGPPTKVRGRELQRRQAR